MVSIKTLLVVLLPFIAISNGAKVHKQTTFGNECIGKPDGTLLPSTESCQKFINCNGGIAYIGDCPADLYFNPNSSRCDYQTNVECHIGEEDEEEEDDVDCPEGGSIAFVASKVRCDWYYICMQGKPSRQVCAAGLHFSETKSQCVAKETANCKIDMSSTIIPSTNPTTTTVIPPSSSPTPTSTSAPPSTSTSAPSTDFDKYCKEDTLHSIPHPFDCSLFILCFNGTAIVRNCGKDLHYSAKNGVCLLPREAKCIADGTICPPNNDVSDIVVVENIYDCNSFYMCFNGSPVPIQCGHDQHWNQETATCVLEKYSECKALEYPFPDLNMREATCHTSGTYFVPQPTNGPTFLLCDNGTSRVIDYSTSS